MQNTSGNYESAWMKNDLGKYKRYITTVPEDTIFNSTDYAMIKRNLLSQYDCKELEIDYQNDDYYIVKREIVNLDDY